MSQNLEKDKIKAQQTQSDKISDANKAKAYELLQRLSAQYSSNEVIAMSPKKTIG